MKEGKKNKGTAEWEGLCVRVDRHAKMGRTRVNID